MKSVAIVVASFTGFSAIAVPHIARVPVGHASLYTREIGTGEPLIVLHGGPDFDHRYLLPDLDRLSDRYRLIYYDQRGRGLSADGVNPEDVTMGSEVEDLDAVRQHFQLESATLVGHSWGTVLALEYAIRHPERVSRLILMNPAPASAADYGAFRAAYRRGRRSCALWTHSQTGALSLYERVGMAVRRSSTVYRRPPAG